jgi:hypothetical protein
LVGNHAYGCAGCALLGLLHQQLQFQFAFRGFLALLGQLLAVVVIIFSGRDRSSVRLELAGPRNLACRLTARTLVAFKGPRYVLRSLALILDDFFDVVSPGRP